MLRMARIGAPERKRAHSILAVVSGIRRSALAACQDRPDPPWAAWALRTAVCWGVAVAKRPRGLPRNAEKQ
jgi:hypothetical protein